MIPTLRWRPRTVAPTASGFTLVELMITVAIVAIGMLGLAKLQAAGMAEASLSRTRAIVTMQGESLASLMRANRAYWGSTSLASGPSVTVSPGSSTATDNSGGTLWASAADCESSPCTTATKVARYDIDKWAANFSNAFPTGKAQVDCTLGTASAPNTCDITLSWTEHYVAINRNSGDASAAKTGTSYMVLHVQP